MVTKPNPSSNFWINVAAEPKYGISAGVAGPFTGHGIFQLAGAGIHLYPSKAAAQAATPETLSAAQAQVLASVLLSGPGIGQGFFGLAQDIPNPLNLLAALSWLEEIGHWIGVFVTAILDPYMWISLGWGLLGLVLLVVGILWWFKSTEAGQKLGKAAGEAAVVAA